MKAAFLFNSNSFKRCSKCLLWVTNGLLQSRFAFVKTFTICKNTKYNDRLILDSFQFQLSNAISTYWNVIIDNCPIFQIKNKQAKLL